MNDCLEMIRRNHEMLDRVFGPAVRMAQEMNRSARGVLHIHENMIRPAIRMAEEMVRMVELGRRRDQRFASLVQKLKWPPPGHLPCTVIDRIAAAYASGQLSDADVEELFVKAYSPRILAEIEQKWVSYGWLADRLTILQEALANYPDGRYHSVVCMLMPQLEGLFGAEFGRTPKPLNDAPVVFRSSPFGDLVSGYYLLETLKTFHAWDPTTPVPDLSRHAILHGRATKYGTKAHALKLIIVTDYLLESLDARHNRAA